MKTIPTSKPAGADAGSARPAGLLVSLGLLAGAAGGALWALSPLGVALSEYAFRTPNVFWGLFFAAPLAMLVGLGGLYGSARRSSGGAVGRVGALGLALAALGALASAVGDVGLYRLGLDDVYLMSAPAYRTFRVGLFVLCLGVLVFAAACAADRRLSVWAFLPLSVGALAGLISVVRDLGGLGAAMWVSFGVAFAWCCAFLFLRQILSALRARRSSKARSAARDG